jgi:hypothetical protein
MCIKYGKKNLEKKYGTIMEIERTDIKKNIFIERIPIVNIT